MPIDFSQLKLERQHSVPLARQLYLQLHQQIMRGTLSHRERLPASRALAEQLHISRGVVVECYDMLNADGLVLGLGKGGTCVCYQALKPSAHKRRPRTLPLSARGQQLADARYYASTADALALQPSVPDPALFPLAQWLKLAPTAWQQAPRWYQRQGGCLRLKQALQRYLAQYRGLQVTQLDNVLITTGTQASLCLLTHLCSDPHDRAAVENPSWLGAQAALKQASLQLQALDLDQQGTCLPPANSVPKLAVLTPSLQFPTGLLMSHERRLEWLQYSQKHGVWLLEDDYAAEYSYDQHPLPCLAAHPEAEQVIYLGTFSKLLWLFRIFRGRTQDVVSFLFALTRGNSHVR